MRSNQSSNRNALNAKNASRSARIGCICGPARHVESRSVATARQTIMRANTCTRAGIRSSRLRSPVSAGCTVILTMPSLSIKLWRFVYRSCRLKRFHECCSHRSPQDESVQCADLWPVHRGAALLHWEDGPPPQSRGRQGRGYRGYSV